MVSGARALAVASAGKRAERDKQRVAERRHSHRREIHDHVLSLTVVRRSILGSAKTVAPSTRCRRRLNKLRIAQHERNITASFSIRVAGSRALRSRLGACIALAGEPVQNCREKPLGAGSNLRPGFRFQSRAPPTGTMKAIAGVMQESPWSSWPSPVSLAVGGHLPVNGVGVHGDQPA